MKAAPARSTRSLLVTGTGARVVTLGLACAFVLVAPRYMGDDFVRYVYWGRVFILCQLLLALGTAGVINRFVHILDETGVERLVRHALAVKLRAAALLVALAAVLAVLAREPLYLLFAGLAMPKAAGEALVLLTYSRERYAARVYNPVVEQLGRLILLPLARCSVLAYLLVSDFLPHLGTLIVARAEFGARRLIGFLRPSRALPPVPDPVLYRRVERDTYLSNLLCFCLPILPALVINHVPGLAVRDLTILYTLGISMIYSLLSAANDILLPRLVRRRAELGYIRRFHGLLALGAFGALAACAMLFAAIRGPVVAWYALAGYDAIYGFLAYSALLVVLNTNRQILYICDRVGLLNAPMAIFYVAVAVALGVGLPPVATLTALVAILVLVNTLQLRAVLRHGAPACAEQGQGDGCRAEPGRDQPS